MDRKLTVTTDVGTFTRRTLRTYSHIVVGLDQRAEVLEARRLRDLASLRRDRLRYVDAIADDCRKLKLDEETRMRNLGSSEANIAGWLASGLFTAAKYAEYLAETERTIEKLEAEGPVTVDTPVAWTPIHWSGRQDLAFAAATADDCEEFREVRIYEVATGALVGTHRQLALAPTAVLESWVRRQQVRRRRSGRRIVRRLAR